MGTVAQLISTDTVQAIAQVTDANGHHAAEVRGPRHEFQLGALSHAQHRSMQIELLVHGSVDQWGRSDSLDPDNVGDIADEGAGHRG